MLDRLKNWFTGPTLSNEEFEAERSRLLARAPAPMFWLFGKTGSGKTSVIKFLTGAERAEIGNGFRPQTERSQEYVFPSPTQPLLRFLDTRGLGEVRYDPAADLARFQESAHLIIVTVRALDHSLEEIVRALREVRGRAPGLPALLLLTCLHEAYPGEQHPLAASGSPNDEHFWNDSLRRSIALQRERFAGLYDRTALVDFTQPSDGFAEPNLGGADLQQVLVEMLPAAFRQALMATKEAMQSLRDLHLRKALPLIASNSLLAATAAAAPVPWIDIPFVMGVQSRMVYQVAAVYGQTVGAALFLKMAGPIGGRLLTRMAVRGALKFVPFVGSAANAALAYAYTYGFGRACCWYFAEVSEGHVPKAEELGAVWREQCDQAAQAWKTSHASQKGPAP